MTPIWLSQRRTVGRDCVEEIQHVGDWAGSNNLRLNLVKSMEIVVVSHRRRRAVVIPPPAVPTMPRVEQIKALGVTIGSKFSVAQHVNHLLVSCGQSLFALRTLRHHVLPTDALHTVFQATVVAKLSYASSAWWGLTRHLPGGDSLRQPIVIV